MASFLRQRDLRPEIMDQPDLDAGLHRTALAALARVNAISNSAGILWPAVRDLCRRGPVRLFDVATGGGDVPVNLLRRARAAGLPLSVAGCDRSDTALSVARQAGADLEWFQHDVLADGVPVGFDVVTCSLFLHHLSDEEAVTFLRSAGQAAGRLLLVNDLNRTAAGYAAAWFGTRLLTRSRIVHADGPQSVAAAFTPVEVQTLAGRAGLARCAVQRRWPFRWLLTYRPDPPS